MGQGRGTDGLTTPVSKGYQSVPAGASDTQLMSAARRCGACTQRGLQSSHGGPEHQLACALQEMAQLATIDQEEPMPLEWYWA